MRRAIVVACTIFLGIGNAASAAVTVYTAEGDFHAASAIVSTETFDSYPPTGYWAATVTLDDVIYETELNPWGPEWGIGVHLGPGYVTSPNDFGSLWPAWDTMSFGDGQYAHALGFWMLSGGLSPTPHWEILVQETSGAVELIDVSFTNDARYYGFDSDVGIRQITVRDYAGDEVSFNWSYDNIAHSQVLPEPATMGLLALGGAAVLRRRRSN